jgi:DHA1 family inner membrane transport protein
VPRLFLLFLVTNLLIGTSAFMVTGLLAPMATSLGTGLSAVGQSTAVYAVATAVLAPIVLSFTGRWSRRTALVAVLALFTLGALVSAAATDLPTLLAARVVMGAGAAATAIMAGIAVDLAPPGRRGQALSIVFMGMSLSYVTGIPLSAWIGLEWGWRVPAWGAALLCACITLALWRGVPALPKHPPASMGAGLAVLIRQPAIRAAYAVTFLYFIAIMTVFSYIGPVLTALVPMSPGELSAAISLFGAAGVTGTVLGGRAADRLGVRRSVSLSLTGMTVCMLLLPLSAGNVVAMMALMMFWGVSGFSLMAPQQSHIAHHAGPLTPLALSLNNSMLYLGTAAGAALGGAVLPITGLAHLPWVSAPMAFAALLVLRWATRPARLASGVA